MRVSTRLLLIIATCLVPTIGLQVALGWSQWAERKAQLGDLVVHQAGLLAGNVEGVAEGARILLAAAATPQLRGSGDECGGPLANLRKEAPGFAFIALVEPEGRIACASDPAVAADGDDVR